ncbi:MAG: hypothetical protein IPN02_10215 [Candidatus Microthrix sp.]|uniref:Uncharacterized protein n=1 Tax=Candidatus Neomicrothrix subdominans TaxID=2954438 RepID=A0A936NDS7_9ACTN|nr:hypothetical protein [Candidatus Microthrix subdominans]
MTALFELPLTDLLWRAQAPTVAAANPTPCSWKHAAVDQDRELPGDCAYCLGRPVQHRPELETLMDTERC